MPEIWDAYNKDGTLAGFDLIRGEKIPNGIYHLVCQIIVRHKDGSFLVMQRDFNKKICPGMYEITAGGSVLKGETALQGAIRELFEETGIKEDSLVLDYVEVSEWKRSIYNMFYVITNCNKNSVRLQKGETVGYEWVSKDELIKRVNESPGKFANPERINKCVLFK